MKRTDEEKNILVGIYMLSFLIAQFGKNNAVPKKYSITGNELMDLTFELLKHVQYCVGGGVVYLDCENVVKVLDFYQNDCNRFKIFGERESDVDQKKVFAITSIFLKNVIYKMLCD